MPQHSSGCMTKNSRNFTTLPNQKHPSSQLTSPLDGHLQYSRVSDPLSDADIDSRKSYDAAERRFQAASWLQDMVGPLELSGAPSEEELWLCLKNGLVLCDLVNRVRPGAVPKIVDERIFSFAPEDASSENLKNFVTALEEMNLPSFDISHLKGGSAVGWSVKLVDSILSIKAYHEKRKCGSESIRKLDFPLTASLPPTQLIAKPNTACSLLEASKKSNNMHEESHGFSRKTKMSCNADFMENLGTAWISSGDSSIAWVQHVCRKYVDTFMAKRSKSSVRTSVLGIPDTNMPCEALLKLVMAVLDDKNPEEVAMLVEFMLRKVIREFGQQTQFEGGEDESYSPSQKFHLEYKNLHTSWQDKSRPEMIVGHYVAKLELQSKEIQELKSALEVTKLQFKKLQLNWEKEKEALGVRLHGLVQAASEYHKVVAENRELYNQIQDLKGNIRVYCRVRPFLPGQKDDRSTVDFISDNGSIMIANPVKQGKDQRKTFTFNKVFGPSATQEQVFYDTQPLIRSVLDGYNVCIFAYGQTGSGKTYTMTGPNNPSPMNWGVNFRALHDLFQISKQRQDIVKYEVAVQMIEIYNEQVRDLLSTESSNKKLEIRNNSQQNGLNVPDANLVPVNFTEDVLELMAMGQKNRAVGSTALNERSSRSHSVLTVHVKGTDLVTGDVLRGCLHLVDLAGSERVDKSEATGDRLKEAQHINKSLSALGDVIAALAQKSSHVPYRNSKLTQLLQDSLGGQAKTLMFVHVSPDCDSYGETISTLKFAERVATVELGAAQSNKENVEAKDLKEQVAFLKDALAKKDAELERYQKEHKIKGNESFLYKPKVDSWLDEDSLKRRSISQGATSDSMSSSTTTSDALLLSSFPHVGSNNCSRNNKIRHHSFDDSEACDSPENLYERVGKVSVGDRKYDDTEEVFDANDINIRQYIHNADRKKQSKISLSSLHVLTSSKPVHPSNLRKKTGSLKELVDAGENYLTDDGLTERREQMLRGQIEYTGENEDTASDYSDAESWQVAGQQLHVTMFGMRKENHKRPVF